MSEVKGSLDYGLLKKALREELAYRRGIKWFLGTTPNRPFSEGMHGMAYQIFGAEEAPDGDVLVCDRYQVLIVSRDYRLKFRYGGKSVEEAVARGQYEGDGEMGCAVYNWETNMILWSLTPAGKIVEIDVATGRKTLEITSIAGTALVNPSASYEFAFNSYPPNPLYTGNIFVADYMLGKVWLIDRAGNVLYTVTHGHPMYAEGHRTDCFVCFYDEHKILAMDVTTPTVYYGMCIPYPTSARQRGIARYVASSDHFRPQVWSGDGFIGLLPFCSERWVSETRELTYLITLHGDLYEFDLKSILPLKPTVPYIYPNIVNRSLGAGAESPIFPIPLYGGIDRCTIYAWSDQAATLRIYVPRPRGDSELLHEITVDASWNPIWRLVDSAPIPAGSQIPYIPSLNGLIGVSVLMGATAGVYDLWAVLE